MNTQDVLFIIGLVLLGIGVVDLGIAAWLFFNRNIPDLLADLSGRKRADALEVMARESRRSRRRSRADESGALATGAIAVEASGGVGSMTSQASMPGPSPSNTADNGLVDEDVDDSAATTVMQDDSAATTVLGPDAADATTMLTTNDEYPNAEVKVDGNASKTTVIQPIKQQAAKQEPIPDSFCIVRKIVLTQSVEFVKPEQGE